MVTADYSSNIHPEETPIYTPCFAANFLQVCPSKNQPCPSNPVFHWKWKPLPCGNAPRKTQGFSLCGTLRILWERKEKRDKTKKKNKKITKILRKAGIGGSGKPLGLRTSPFGATGLPGAQNSSRLRHSKVPPRLKAAKDSKNLDKNQTFANKPALCRWKLTCHFWETTAGGSSGGLIPNQPRLFEILLIFKILNFQTWLFKHGYHSFPNHNDYI